MGTDDSGKMKPLYRIRPTFTPLPQSSTTGLGGEHGGNDASADAATSSLAHGAARDAATHTCSQDGGSPASGQRAGVPPLARAANEDDDLYDPYSDLHDGTLKPLEFERDPWR